MKKIRLKDSFVFLAFSLSVVVLFLQQFYSDKIVIVFIHIIDFLVLALVLVDLFLPLFKEKYVKKYFQDKLFDTVFTVIFFIAFILFKINLDFFNPAEDVNLIFALFKNIFLLVKIVYDTSHQDRLTRKVISNPAQTLVISFLTVIITGTFLLMLPAASTGKHNLDFLSSLFTAASAVCVTGLSVIDVSVQLTFVGKCILLILIQIGGLGIMVFSFFGMLALRKKISLADKMTVSYMVSDDDMSSLFKTLRVIVLSTFGIEAISALFLLIGFSQIFGFGKKALFFSVFHAISAFCNAGFSLFTNSLESFTGNTIITLTISLTIILGGLSFAVLYDISKKIKSDFNSKLLKKKNVKHIPNLTTKVVLFMTVILILVSFILFYLLEYNHSMLEFSLAEQYLASFFQAVTLRTAGFSTVNFGTLKNATLLFMVFIMFIGGASGSTAGGIKINTITVVFAFFDSFLKNRKTVVIMKKSISEDQVKKAFLIFGFGLISVCIAIFILTISESISFLPLFFETVSAFATVGLSAGITSSLSSIGRIVIIILMFLGRVGALTILTALGEKENVNHIEYSSGNISIG